MQKDGIKRRDFIKGAGAGALGVIACSRRVFSSQSSPNIIYILLDDAGYGDLSCYGQERFQTPNMDRLATEGVRFTDHYAASAVCAPSRCCLLTGKHTGHAYIRGNRPADAEEGQMPLRADAVTFPRLLQEAGYVNGAFGKWGLGPPGSSGDPNEQGFDEFFGYNCQSLAHNYYPDHLWHNREKVELDGDTYSHDLIMEKAMEFIKRNHDRNFFCYLPVTIPHAALHVPEESAEKFRKKFWMFELVPGFYDGPVIRNPAACFAGMMTRLDRQVGEIMELVSRLGIDDNTIIMLTSDNGPHLEGGAVPWFFDSNGPFRGYKRDLYEGGIRVPMIARWPGHIRPGSVTDHPSVFWDVMPTMCELAGVSSPSAIDGISMLPALLGDNDRQEEHQHLYWELHELGGRQAVRSGRWKAVRYNVSRNRDKGVELYDLREDPGEKNDLADKKPEVAHRMLAIMREARTESEHFKLFK
ncbi:MAG: arylsulfatase [bacterium]